MSKMQKIAIPTEDGRLCLHFGKTPQVTFLTIKDGVVVGKVLKNAPEHAHGVLPRFLFSEGCTDVLCGGLGDGASQLLDRLGIRVHAGAPALEIDLLIQKFMNGTIVYSDGHCHHDGCDGHHFN